MPIAWEKLHEVDEADQWPIKTQFTDNGPSEPIRGRAAGKGLRRRCAGRSEMRGYVTCASGECATATTSLSDSMTVLVCVARCSGNVDAMSSVT
jgi:hypothetical protein